jgi:hypothetical protein
MLFASTFRAFHYRDYLIFWCGLFLGHTGTLMQATAQSWLIFQLTDSPFYLGLEGFCLGLPRVLFQPSAARWSTVPTEKRFLSSPRAHFS